MTQEEFAGRIGISQNYPTLPDSIVERRSESGDLLRISREFAQSVELLLTGEGYTHDERSIPVAKLPNTEIGGCRGF